MLEQMKAINHYVVVDKIKTEVKKVAGLIMTEDLDEDNRYIKANVISVGNLVEGVKDGDVIHYDKHAGHGIQYKDKLYFVIRASDIVLVD
jgi:co-chaperonin GroES (HSP10)